MARDNSAMIRNTNYLNSRIEEGKLTKDGNGYVFNMPSAFSIYPEMGMMVYVDLKTGEVTTMDLQTDDIVSKIKSKEKRGYVTVELYVPWKSDSNDNKNTICGTSEWTCYIHRIVGVISSVLAQQAVCNDYDVNHKDGWHCNNKLNNVEMCSSKWNIIHGYLLELAYRTRGLYMCDTNIEVLTDEDGHKYLSNGISYKMLETVYNNDIRFKELIDKCWSDKHSRDETHKNRILDPDVVARINRYYLKHPEIKDYIVK